MAALLLLVVFCTENEKFLEFNSSFSFPMLLSGGTSADWHPFIVIGTTRKVMTYDVAYFFLNCTIKSSTAY